MNTKIFFAVVDIVGKKKKIMEAQKSYFILRP